MAFCNQCGAPVPDGAPFCSNCGAAQLKTTAPRLAGNAPAGNSRKGLIAGLAVVSTLLVAGIVVLILFLTGVIGGGDDRLVSDALTNTTTTSGPATTTLPMIDPGPQTDPGTTDDPGPTDDPDPVFDPATPFSIPDISGPWLAPSGAGYSFHTGDTGYYQDENGVWQYDFFWRELLGLPPDALYGIEMYQENSHLGTACFYQNDAGGYYMECDGTVYERAVDPYSVTTFHTVPEAYNPVLVLFMRARRGENVSIGLPEEDPLSYGGNNVLFELSNGMFEDDAIGLGFVLQDLDGNGTEELLIGRNSMIYSFGDAYSQGKEAAEILAVYTIREGEAVPVLFGWSRSNYYLRNDGSFAHFGSSGAADSYAGVWALSDDVIMQNGSGVRYYDGTYYELPMEADTYDTANLHPLDDATAMDWWDDFGQNTVTLEFKPFS